MKPLVIELFAGKCGWGKGFVAEGWRHVGFDIVHEEWHRPVPDGCLLVLQDVLTLHGSQFREAGAIVASPPCQEYSYRAMPWKRAKALPPPSNALFDACFRIQREANQCGNCDGTGWAHIFPGCTWEGHTCEVCGGTGQSKKYIPMVVENVHGAERWVGRAKWKYGAFYLWGDVPSLMPIRLASDGSKEDVIRKTNRGNVTPADLDSHYGSAAVQERVPRNGGVLSPAGNAVPPVFRSELFGWKRDTPLRSTSSHSAARKAASAAIAEIPFELSSYIARVFRP